jgi:hypothetical protein
LRTYSLSVIAVALFVMPCVAFGSEPTKASQSVYNTDILQARTSKNLTKADIAWHAVNTYGWDCEEVVSKGKPAKDGSYVITCSNGKKLRVFPRPGKHPRITNLEGTYR